MSRVTAHTEAFLEPETLSFLISEDNLCYIDPFQKDKALDSIKSAVTKDVREKVDELKKKVSSKNKVYWHLSTLSSIIHIQQGVLYLRARDFPGAENELNAALSELNGAEYHPAGLSVALAAHMALGQLWTWRGQHSLATKHCCRADEMASRLETENLPVYSFQDWFRANLTGSQLNGIHFYKELKSNFFWHPSQNDQISPSEVEKRYLFNEMKSQLTKAKQLNVSHFVRMSYRLTFWLIKENDLDTARHHLAAIKLAMDLNNREADQETSYTVTKLKMYYSVGLLQMSVLLYKQRKRVWISSKKEASENSDLRYKEMERTISSFDNLPKCAGRDYKECLPIFLFGKREVDRALMACPLDSTQEHVVIVRAESEMYRCLAQVLQDKIVSKDILSKVSKLHKRRIVALEKCLTALENSQNEYYDLYGEVLNELSLVYMELLELKQKKFEKTANNLDPRLIQKMAYLCFTGIKHSRNYVKLITNSDGEIISHRLRDSRAEAVLVALYRIGRFYNKIFTPVAEDQIKFTMKAIEFYDIVVTYCRKNEDHGAMVKELAVQCIDTADLLKRQIKLHEKNMQIQASTV